MKEQVSFVCHKRGRFMCWCCPRASSRTSILLILTEKPASLLVVLKHADETGMTGDGQKALQELVDTKVTDEVIRAKKDKLVNSNMKHGEVSDS